MAGGLPAEPTPSPTNPETQVVQAAVDPIDKLKALAELERVATIDETGLREGFVAHAKAWAEQAGVPVLGFREMKAPDDVLRAAGTGPSTTEPDPPPPTGSGRARETATEERDTRAVLDASGCGSTDFGAVGWEPTCDPMTSFCSWVLVSCTSL